MVGLNEDALIAQQNRKELCRVKNSMPLTCA